MAKSVLAGVTHWAEAQLQAFASITDIKLPFTAEALLTERARINAFPPPSQTSSGGGCHLYRTRDGAIGLNLARPDDRDLLPAFFGVELDQDSSSPVVASQRPRPQGRGWERGAGAEFRIAALIQDSAEIELVVRGREMGLAIAGLREDRSQASPAIDHTLANTVSRPANRSPRIIDLSALWAGPLATRLLHLAGAQVTKVESQARPDAMREGDPEFFVALNAGKQETTLDLKSPQGVEALISLLAGADIVIESSRPRALLQLGIDADALVQSRPGQIWLSITGHGVRGDAANWIGFGDDCGVAGGLSAAHFDQTGELAFVGDAIADPLTGITAARVAAEAWARGEGGRWILSMSGIVSEALASC